MGAVLIDIDRLKRATMPEMDGQRDDVLQLSIEAASDMIHGIVAPRQLVDPGAGTEWVEYYDGDLSVGRWFDEIYLRSFPVIQVVTLKENGVPLVFGTGYDPSGSRDVTIDSFSGVLRRGAGPTPIQSRLAGNISWANGRQNIEVKYRAGFSPAAIPGDLQMWAVMEATKFFEDPARSGRTNVSRPSGGTSYDLSDLPAAYQGIAHRYVPWGRPRCWSGS